jgi:hypothetical protein
MAVVVVLIYLSMSSVLSSDSVDITSPRGIVNAMYVYVGWLGETTASLFDISKETAVATGNAIKVEEEGKADLPEVKEKSSSFLSWITDKIRKD